MTKARLGIFYKNFAAWKGVSHIGLGVAALANAEYLNSHDEYAAVVPVRHNIDIVNAIHENNFTHVAISAPWISTRDMAAMCEYFHGVHFSVVSHSNVGFLQADPRGIHLLRDYIELTRKFDNFTVGGNTERFTQWVSEAYDTQALLLPNMYPVSKLKSTLNGVKHDLSRICRSGLRIGSFGAIRPLKNQLTAAAAAIIIGQRLGVPIEFHLSAGREEGGGNIVLEAIQQMTEHLDDFNLVLDGWVGWNEFRENVRTMDLLIHPSYTESFNMVTADGVAQGVPTVVSPAIVWLPRSWQVDSDDAVAIAETGMRLLNQGAGEGVNALQRHNEFAFRHWREYLST